MHALCVDVGTSLIKSVAYDGDGRELAVERRPSEVLRPAPGHAEQDMGEVWAAVADTVRRARRALPEDPALIAVTAQGDGCWLVDADGEPVGPAILWNDARHAEIVERWRGDGTIERAFEINGSLSFPGLANAILPWLREHEPERLARADKAMHCGGWLFLKLTGEVVVDESDASAPLLDIRTREYSGELLELFGLEWAERLLPEPVPAGSCTRPLSAAAALELGLPAGVPVVLAPYDIAATAIGVGATAPGQACSILGTTLCTELVLDRVETDGPPAGFTIVTSGGDRYLRAFPTLAGTGVIDWAVRLLGLSGPAELSSLAAGAALEADSVVFLPYLSPAGERAPFLDPGARGMFLGLTLEHRPEQLALAVLEGLSHVVLDCLRAARAEAGELRLCGGGASSEWWCRLIADVTGLPALRSTDRELGAKGALLCGLVAIGADSDLDGAAARLVRLRDSFEPRDERRELHARRFADFLELRRHCEPAWRTLRARREPSAGTPRVGAHG